MALAYFLFYAFLVLLPPLLILAALGLLGLYVWLGLRIMQRVAPRVAAEALGGSLFLLALGLWMTPPVIAYRVPHGSLTKLTEAIRKMKDGTYDPLRDAVPREVDELATLWNLVGSPPFAFYFAFALSLVGFWWLLRVGGQRMRRAS